MPEKTPKFSSILEALKIVGYKVEDNEPKTFWEESEWSKRLRKEEEARNRK